MAPAAHQSRRQVLQTRKLYLQLAFVALRALGKDLQDQRSAVSHRNPEVTLQIALLCRRQRLVKNHTFGAVHLHQGLDLISLAAADEQRRIGRLAPCDHPLNGHVASAFGQQRQFVKRRVKGLAFAEIHTDQHHPRGPVASQGRRLPRLRAQAVGTGHRLAGGLRQAWSTGSAALKVTGRPGTTVEIACL